MSAGRVKQFVALFTAIDYAGSRPSAWTRHQSWDGKEQPDYCPPGHVRMSEWVEVEFPPLASEEVVRAQVEAVTQQRAKVVDEFTQKLANIDAHLANLRCITHQVEE